MFRRALARHRTYAALLLGLCLRAPSASAEPSEPDEIHVHRAPPGNVGYFLDRMRVPFLYRVRFDPSVIHLGLIDRVDPYRGGYPVRFGLIETPFALGRGSLLPLLLSLLSPEVKLAYRDHQTRASHEPSARDRFSELGSYAPLAEKKSDFLTRLSEACRPKLTLTW